MNFKNRLSGLARQAKGAMRTHQSSIERGIDKAADLANQKTGAKHDQRIRKGTQHLRTGLGKVTGNTSVRPATDDSTPGKPDNEGHRRDDSDGDGAGAARPY